MRRPILTTVGHHSTIYWLLEFHHHYTIFLKAADGTMPELLFGRLLALGLRLHEQSRVPKPRLTRGVLWEMTSGWRKPIRVHLQ